jgi:hypothetical protein
MLGDAGTARPSAVAGLAARGGLAAPAVTGIRFAVEPGSGRSAVPVRSVLAGTATAILTVVAAFVFGTSLRAMLTTPKTYGWNFDLIAAGGDAEENLTGIQQKLAASPLVAEFSQVSVKTTTFNGRDLETLGIEPIKGSVHTVVLEGRFPTAADEVALAARTFREARVKMGDRVTLPAPDETCAAAPCVVSFRVVGKTIHWGEGTDTDDGAAFTKEGQARVRTSGGFIDFLVRVPPGPSHLASIRALERELGDTISPYTSSAIRGSAKLPQNLRNVDRVRTLPTIVAVVLAVLALVTLIHALLMTARRRRYDLAVLKTMGFVRRQVAATVAWQASTLVLLALLVGVPLGIVGGRWTWTLLASRLGVVVSPAVEPWWIVLGAGGTVLLAMVVSLLPGRSAAKTRPAVVLRTE